MNNTNAGGLLTLPSKQLGTVVTHSDILTVKGLRGCYKSSGCSNESKYLKVGLWTRCINYSSSIVNDEDIMYLETVDPI